MTDMDLSNLQHITVSSYNCRSTIVAVCLYTYSSIVVPVCPYSSIVVPVCPYSSIVVPVCPYTWASIVVPVCPYSSIVVPVCPYSSIVVPVCPYTWASIVVPVCSYTCGYMVMYGCSYNYGSTSMIVSFHFTIIPIYMLRYKRRPSAPLHYCVHCENHNKQIHYRISQYKPINVSMVKDLCQYFLAF